jgi:L-ascorbate metabolism protein UlaG (beta-lactamase superfamily)
MRLTKFTHACVRMERDGAVLVIDPGGFTEAEALDGADAVLITHEHFDHLDVDKLVAARADRPDLTVHTHPAVAPKLAALGDGVSTVDTGDEFTAAGFRVRAYGGIHAEIHSDVPRVANLGFLLVEESVYHPGDSLDAPDTQIETLLLPIMAPWLKLAEAVEFVRSVAPRRAYAIHDHLLSPAGAMVFDRNLENLSGRDYQHLEPGTTVPA